MISAICYLQARQVVGWKREIFGPSGSIGDAEEGICGGILTDFHNRAVLKIENESCICAGFCRELGNAKFRRDVEIAQGSAEDETTGDSEAWSENFFESVGTKVTNDGGGGLSL